MIKKKVYNNLVTNKRAEGYVIIKNKNEAQPKYYSYRQTPTIHSRIIKKKKKGISTKNINN